MKSERWNAEIITYRGKRKKVKGEADAAAPEYNVKIDFTPEGKPHGIMIWRTDKTDQAIDDDLYELSRKASRIMQGK